jgi:hypothetical protein
MQKIYLHMLRMRETGGKLQREGENFKLGYQSSGYKRAEYTPRQPADRFAKLSAWRVEPRGFLLRPYPSHATKWWQVSD